MMQWSEQHFSQMLADANAKTRKLVTVTELQLAELGAEPSSLLVETLSAGKQAYKKTLTSAEEMLQALEIAAGLPDKTANYDAD
jgi:hypothetical protein